MAESPAECKRSNTSGELWFHAPLPPIRITASVPAGETSWPLSRFALAGVTRGESNDARLDHRSGPHGRRTGIRRQRGERGTGIGQSCEWLGAAADVTRREDAIPLLPSLVSRMPSSLGWWSRLPPLHAASWLLTLKG
jgi:hypothetical protein